MRKREMKEVESLVHLEKPSKICCVSVSHKKARVFRQMVDFSLFKDPIFLMYAVSNFLTSIGFNVPYVYTVDQRLGH